MNVTIWIASLDEMLRFQNKVVQRKVHVKGGCEIYSDHLKEFWEAQFGMNMFSKHNLGESVDSRIGAGE